MADDLSKPPELTIVIPCRESEDAETTLNSLAQQTYQDFRTIVVKDEGRGANWARNFGFLQVESEFVLFSDNDIEWHPMALETMMRVLKQFTGASYCYGRFVVYGGTGPEAGTVWGHEPWDANVLRDHNYISTMSIWRTKDFPGFDETIHRLQDWDVYLTALEAGKRGIYCEDLVFRTKVRDGITQNGPDLIESENIVRMKHGLKNLNVAVSTMPKL